MATDALLLLEADQALALHPDGGGLVAFDSASGQGAECCCGGACGGRSPCCDRNGGPACLPTKDAYFPDDPAAPYSGIFQHGPLAYSFKGTIQTCYPTRQTEQIGPGFYRRLYAPLTVELDLSGADLLIPRDALSYAPELKASNQTIPGFFCAGVAANPTPGTPATYPLYGCACVLSDTLLAEYVTGNDGTNHNAAYTVAGSLRAQVCAIYTPGHAGWPLQSPVTKIRFEQALTPFGHLLGSQNVLNAGHEGVWTITLVLYHVRQPLLDGNKTVVKGVIVGGSEPLISVGSDSLHARAVGAVYATGAVRIDSAGGGFAPQDLDVDGSLTREFTRGPSGGVEGFTNSCGCVVRVCGSLDMASRFEHRPPFGGGVPTGPSTDAHQDYKIAYDVSWGAISKCSGTSDDSETQGDCGGTGGEFPGCAAYLAAWLAGDATADYNGDGFVNGDDYDAFSADHPECFDVVQPSQRDAVNRLRGVNRPARLSALTALDLLR